MQALKEGPNQPLLLALKQWKPIFGSLVSTDSFRTSTRIQYHLQHGGWVSVLLEGTGKGTVLCVPFLWNTQCTGPSQQAAPDRFQVIWGQSDTGVCFCHIVPGLVFFH